MNDEPFNASLAGAPVHSPVPLTSPLRGEAAVTTVARVANSDTTHTASNTNTEVERMGVGKGEGKMS